MYLFTDCLLFSHDMCTTRTHNSLLSLSSLHPLFPQMRSVDRVFKFIDLPQEEPRPSGGGGKGTDLVIDNPHAQDCWPNQGHMDVQGLTVKYTEAGRSVLQDLSFTVEGGQSVGHSLCVSERAGVWLMRG